jgi:hypothetical protein
MCIVHLDGAATRRHAPYCRKDQARFCDESVEQALRCTAVASPPSHEAL